MDYEQLQKINNIARELTSSGVAKSMDEAVQMAEQQVKGSIQSLNEVSKEQQVSETQETQESNQETPIQKVPDVQDDLEVPLENAEIQEPELTHDTNKTHDVEESQESPETYQEQKITQENISTQETKQTNEYQEVPMTEETTSDVVTETNEAGQMQEQDNKPQVSKQDFENLVNIVKEQQNTLNHVIGKMNELIKGYNDLENGVNAVKKQQEQKEEFVKPVVEEPKDKGHARTGNYNPENVSMEKIFYSGSNR